MSRGGEEYSRMLKCLLHSNLDAPPTKPLEIPHTVIDRIHTPTEDQLAHPRCSTVSRALRLSRKYFLLLVIWDIMLTFYGMREARRTVRTARPLIIPTEGVSESALREVMREHNELRKLIPNACSYCGLSEDRMPAGRKLRARSKCRQLNRRVFHCSKECQTKDWKFGTLRPHKLVCGKPLTVDTISEASPTEAAKTASWILDPDPSFTRSPALLHQISLLSDHPRADYVVGAIYHLV
ncbi:uncharacterized protein PHACADRAFT_184876 [Phanerochaete carnosa HHB-10118-sp]|uniref:MYND-type domain-containing protein n=1 Tax=Phanerochaete carnosa (strain HHB-10118-sp) TaxID=650164 RepID=K5WB29_PHACS|nr:uncharacterized protein PHACADRAFT_184876 [Phanerochaete carnosa HHB-10118-sp]EKM56199.1 hypothetical protein PHACADRAFT_184876 [Phanerochaete carnosa HHB-10118-sp]